MSLVWLHGVEWTINRCRCFDCKKNVVKSASPTTRDNMSLETRQELNYCAMACNAAFGDVVGRRKLKYVHPYVA